MADFKVSSMLVSSRGSSVESRNEDHFDQPHSIQLDNHHYNQREHLDLVSPISNLEQKPIYSYSSLIVMSIRSSPKGMLTLNQICQYIMNNYPFYQNNQDSWNKSIRHNLTVSELFLKVPRPINDPGRGCYWTLNPEAEDMSISTTTGRLRRSTIKAVNPYQPHLRYQYPYFPSTRCAEYFPTWGEVIRVAMPQQLMLQEQQLRTNHYAYQQEQQMMRYNHFIDAFNVALDLSIKR